MPAIEPTVRWPVKIHLVVSVPTTKSSCGEEVTAAHSVATRSAGVCEVTCLTLWMRSRRAPHIWLLHEASSCCPGKKGIFHQSLGGRITEWNCLYRLDFKNNNIKINPWYWKSAVLDGWYCSARPSQGNSLVSVICISVLPVLAKLRRIEIQFFNFCNLHKSLNKDH